MSGPAGDRAGSLAERAEREVHARHDFFVAWFAGEALDADFAATERAFAPDLVRIGPDGARQDRDAVLAMLRAARGAHPAGFAIEIAVGEARALGPDLVLVVYDERQRIGAGRTARRTTALFGRDDAAPEGAVWRHLHETWITDKANPEEPR
jgi:hypothetical protein